MIPIPPARQPTGMKTPERKGELERIAEDLDQAKAIVEKILAREVKKLSEDALVTLRNVWAYLHECFCAEGERPHRPVIMLAGRNAHESNGDMAFRPKPKSWVTNWRKK